ncbi:diacylglycerol/lipid kinase family protein [Deinococcus hopiensis]|uniref:Diacylglycerol kinase family enzyme n=1 Tax=Deinococcus hopiensis KR-140 TaxID=695939 RepID=A0A1W1V850_9DEIO|nr:diacylglycerol kinase family protein [Deinococcus hopiensis]SMB89360.1 Diacylglycerol kinase family enzyme [Deinococcus hopiensis KR-140]
MTLDLQAAYAQEAPSAENAAPRNATLIFNGRAGGSERFSPDMLVEGLHALGYHPVYRATDDEADIEAALQDVSGAVFVAGGDGTIRATALHLAGRSGVCLGLIPMGTANNIARTLGITGDPLEVIAAYAGGKTAPLDLGRVTAPWGEDLFLEACGCGAFADVLAEYDPEEGKSPLRAAGALVSTLRDLAPPALALTIDGQAQPLRHHAVLEVMNTHATGPRLRLAPNASPCDGQLNLVRVDAEERDGILAYLSALARGEFDALPSVQNDTVTRAGIPYVGQAFHVDGEVRPPQPGVSGKVQIEVWAGALRVLLPAQGQQEG